MCQNNYPTAKLFSNTSSPLQLSILTCLALTFVANGGDTVICDDTTVCIDNFFADGESDNTVIVDYNATTINYVFGAKSESNKVENNKVFMKKGTVNRSVYGARSINNDAIGNNIKMSGGTVTEFVIGGRSFTHGNATGNSVTLIDGTVKKSIFGGQSEQGNSTKNHIIISGGKVENNVIGGNSINGKATNNTVTINGKKALDLSSSWIMGGKSYAGDDAFTGNTLNVHRKEIKVKKVANFENYYFNINKEYYTDVVVDTINNSTSSMIDTAKTSTIDNSFYHIDFEGGTPKLTPGKKIKLISKTNMPNPNARFGIAKQGISRIYDVEYKKQGSALIAQIKSDGRVNPQSIALLESGLATNDFINRGGDLAVNDGLNALKQSQSKNKNLFIATRFGKNRTETGSHIDVVGANFLLGIGKHIDNSTGRLDVGVFAELGSGSYDTHNEFDSMPNVKASGSTRYFGVGVMAEQIYNSGLRLNAGVRIGKTNTSFNSKDLASGFVGQTSFDSERNYISSFAGVGYEMPLAEDSKLDIYGNLNYTYLGDDDQTIEGDRFHFDAIDSVRSKVGARWTKVVGKNGNTYAGVAWEHEFDGTAAGSVLNMAMSEPSLKGSTAVLEAGYTFNAEYDKNLQFSLGANGSVGKRKSLSVNTELQYDY